jgi:hypothetical protein
MCFGKLRSKKPNCPGYVLFLIHWSGPQPIAIELCYDCVPVFRLVHRCVNVGSIVEVVEHLAGESLLPSLHRLSVDHAVAVPVNLAGAGRKRFSRLKTLGVIGLGILISHLLQAERGINARG